jgi:hypothetical protein
MIDTVISILLALVMVAFGAFCGVMGVMIFNGNLKALLRARRSKIWPACLGRVVSADLVYVGFRSGWKVNIQYKYRLDGVEYTGQRVDFAYFDSYSRREAEEIMARFPQDAERSVFYDPARPGEAALVQTAHGAGCNMILLPVFLLLPMALCIGSGLFGLVSTLQK